MALMPMFDQRQPLTVVSGQFNATLSYVTAWGSMCVVRNDCTMPIYVYVHNDQNEPQVSISINGCRVALPGDEVVIPISGQVNGDRISVAAHSSSGYVNFYGVKDA